MNDVTEGLAGHEPSLHTVEMVCDRLAEMGVAVGPDTARELVLAVLAAEAPRVDARIREALDTALETIRVAAQAAMGVLKTTSPATPRPRPAEPPSPPRRERTPLPERRPAARRPAEEPREPREPPPGPPPPRDRDDFDLEERRPVFRRPRGR